MPPELFGFHHVSLSVTDLARSTTWYQQVLGLDIAAEIEGAGFRRIRLRAPGGGVILTLTCHDERSGDRFDERRTGMDHVSFRVAGDQQLAWTERLEQLGVEHSGIKPTTSGGSMITMRDPDNIQLELFFG